MDTQTITLVAEAFKTEYFRGVTDRKLGKTIQTKAQFIKTSEAPTGLLLDLYTAYSKGYRATVAELSQIEPVVNYE